MKRPSLPAVITGLANQQRVYPGAPNHNKLATPRCPDLQAVLKALEIPPLPLQSVVFHKQQSLSRGVRWRVLATFGIFLAIIGAAVVATEHVADQGIGVPLAGIMLAVFGTTLTNVGLSKSSGSWRIVPMAHYFGDVPEFVIRKVSCIQKLLPNATFYVEACGTDPFLIIDNQGVREYIEVWGEPRFEAQL